MLTENEAHSSDLRFLFFNPEFPSPNRSPFGVCPIPHLALFFASEAPTLIKFNMARMASGASQQI